ncbi:MAG TPA: site-specific integrase [Actinomycetota bacterium]|nr:site-specific integrase [Actinomycetota bacterium]
MSADGDGSENPQQLASLSIPTSTALTYGSSSASPGVWRIVVSNGFDEGGRRQQVVRTVHGGKRDAQRVLTATLGELDQGVLTDGRQPLAGYLRDEWLPGVSKVCKRGRPLAPTTRRRYSDAIEHVARIIGKVRLRDLRPKHVEKVREQLLAEGLAPQTVGSILRVAIAGARTRGGRGYCRNVASVALVNRPAAPRPRFEVIDRSKARSILAAVEGTDSWDAAVHLALGLGLRREEVLALRWDDVNDTVAVHRPLTYADGELHVGAPKSAAGERDLPLPAFVDAALRRHRKAQTERRLPLGIRSELVVDNGVGEPWMPASFSTAWRRFADAVALEVMGHAGVAMLRHYQEVADELRRDAAMRIDALLGGEHG